MNQEIVTTLDTEFYTEKYIPYGYINKSTCGCGMTTVAIENDRHTIIAVPNVSLIENKVEQYANPNERLRARTSNKLIGVYGKMKSNTIQDALESQLALGQPIKIMVTYDSLHKVSHLLDNFDCDLMIDESDMIQGYAQLKSSQDNRSKNEINWKDCITNMLTTASKHSNKVSFVSATPSPVECFPQWVQDLPQHRVEFTTAIPVLPIKMKRENPILALRMNIINPLVKNGIVNLGVAKPFKKVIIFLNSISKAVEAMQDVVETGMISIKDVGFIIGDTVENDNKIRKVGHRLENPTQLPLITFVTGTGVRGIDIDDKEAMSVVVSDSKGKYTKFDVLSDLKQAASRQRNKENINYGKYVFIYNQSITEESVDSALKAFDEEIAYMNTLIKEYDDNLIIKHYGSNDSILLQSVIKRYCFIEDGMIVRNTNLIISDRNGIDKLLRQYINGYFVSGGEFLKREDTESLVIEDLGLSYDAYYKFAKKYIKANPSATVIEWNDICPVSEHSRLIDMCIARFYELPMKDRLYSTKRDAEYAMITPADETYILHIKRRFDNVTIETVDNVKKMLNKLYAELGITRKAKSTDLTEFYPNAKFTTKRIDGKAVSVVILKDMSNKPKSENVIAVENAVEIIKHIEQVRISNDVELIRYETELMKKDKDFVKYIAKDNATGKYILNSVAKKVLLNN